MKEQIMRVGMVRKTKKRPKVTTKMVWGSQGIFVRIGADPPRPIDWFRAYVGSILLR